MRDIQKIDVNDMWTMYRADGRMVSDAPARKIGAPFPAAYLVAFPVEIDGHLVFVELGLDEVPKLAIGLMAALPDALAMTNIAEGEHAAHDVIRKAQESARPA